MVALAYRISTRTGRHSERKERGGKKKGIVQKKSKNQCERDRLLSRQSQAPFSTSKVKILRKYPLVSPGFKDPFLPVQQLGKKRCISKPSDKFHEPYGKTLTRRPPRLSCNIFCLSRAGFEPATSRWRGAHALHYTIAPHMFVAVTWEHGTKLWPN